MASLPTQIVQYECDSVEVSYSDGALLQLSPCAACFVYHQPVDDLHPVYGKYINLFSGNCYCVPNFIDKTDTVKFYFKQHINHVSSHLCELQYSLY